MKNNILLFPFLSLLLVGTFCLLLSCSNTAKDKDKSDVKAESFQTNIKTDEELMSEKYIEVIVDRYDNGQIFHVDYYDIENPSEKAYERKFYRSGQKFMEGALVGGERHGKWLAWYENGNLWSSADYKNGKEHGSNVVYYENGQVRYTKEHINGVANGLWQFFAPDGRLLGEIMYQEGKVEWEKDYSSQYDQSF